MKRRVLAAAVALATVNAYALDGKVVNTQGEPIAGAVIEGSDNSQTLRTDVQGRFKIDGDVDEIHITAPGFGHRIVHLHELDGEPLVIRLAPTVLEQLDVVGLPIHASITESAMPVAVLSGEALRDQQAATLGDTLDGQVGVHTSFHGNVASTPIIRGLSGPRVMITQNGLDVSDVSRVGPDHSVASEVSTAQQVEILRGPATLFYGSGAIGGVVNVVDQRVPTDNATRGEWLLSHDTVNSQDVASFNLNTGEGDVAVHVDGFWRDAENYEVPVEPEQDAHNEDHEGDFTVANSAEESSGYTLGTSYLLDEGYVGISVGRLDREYGIPGHSHGHAEGEDVSVYADLEQNRYQLLSELDINSRWLRAVHTRAAYTDYTHAEVEDGVVGTVFSNETAELRVDLLHQEVAHWRGGVNLHYKSSDVSAEGEEAFTPPSESETLALALMEERHIGDVLVQFGARVERVTIDASDVLLPDLAVHDHDHEEAHGHDHEAAVSDTRVFAVEQEFTPISVSLGAVWNFQPGYNLGVSLSRSQRAPSASELLSFGPHIGTRSYEVGALFDVHEEDYESHFELSDTAFDLETANNIDLTFRKHEGDLAIVLNAFYNKVDNYYYQAATGLFAESGHAHGHGEDAGEEDAHSDELPVYLFTSADAVLHGFEAQGIWQMTPSFKTTVFSDYVRAELEEDGDYLPRTPPLRYGARLDYNWQQVSANVSWTHYDDQDKVAQMETGTDGYDWVDATVTYYLPVASHEIALFVKGENLTDTEARVHTSFLKDIAPRPGRNFSVGLRGTF